jgi:hypothetical protein
MNCIESINPLDPQLFCGVGSPTASAWVAYLEGASQDQRKSISAALLRAERICKGRPDPLLLRALTSSATLREVLASRSRLRRWERSR